MTTGAPTITGRVGSTTPEQEVALKALKEQLLAENAFVPKRHDEHYLLRFLRARRFDVALAKKMLLDCEKWRIEFKVDELAQTFEFPEADQVKKYYPQYYHKTDKVGRPIYVEHLGKLDLKALLNVTTMDRMHQKHVYEYEKLIHHRMPACSAKAGRYLEQSCSIIDLKGVSLFAFSQVYSFVKQVSQIAQDYYPEMLGKMFIINSPMLFSSVWNLVKPLLDEVTVNKISILGSNYQKELLSMIDPENLPVELGGKCQCNGLCENSDAGPWQEQEWQEKGTQLMKKIEEATKNGTPLKDVQF